MKHKRETTAEGGGRAAALAKLALVSAVACVMFVSLASARNLDLLDREVLADQLSWWNDATVARVWGCDNCNVGDIACSLGSALKTNRGMPCGYIYKIADYYGYNDKDDIRAMANPLYKRMDGVWDTKMDYESGRPDFAVVNESLVTIQTNISAYFVREARWKGKPYWMHIDKTTPGGGDIDYQTWLMPCKDDTQARFYCLWSECKVQSTASCGCDNSNSSMPGYPCYNYTCTVAGQPEKCYITGGQCWEDDWTSVPCNHDGPGGQGCSSCPAYDPSKGYMGVGGTDNKPGVACCWTCSPRDVDTGDEPASYCGWGGSEIELDMHKTEKYNYTDYPKRDQTGADMNDDVQLAIPPFTSRIYWGNMPAVLGGADDDFVRDRFWIRNATDKEFLGTRTGYCSNEKNGNPGSCVQTPGSGTGMSSNRDQYDRPTTRQHDPCRSCISNVDYVYDVDNKQHNLDNPVCADECFNYDLRYYRQPNINSLFAHIIGISPEVETPFMAPAPNDTLADQKVQCADRREGRYDCSAKDIGQTCTDTSQCIDGMICTGFLTTPEANKHCCPMGTYYWEEGGEACCRYRDNHICSELVLDCPKDKRTMSVKAWWGEFVNEPIGWWLENMFGVQRNETYRAGIGEKGCLSDADCATYKYPYNLKDDLTQVCSKGDFNGDVTKQIIPNRCCPNLGSQPYQYDATYNCCLPADQAVKLVKMHDYESVYRSKSDEGIGSKTWLDTGYCEEKKIETGNLCNHGEGPCRNTTRDGKTATECTGDLVCAQSFFSTSKWETACCTKDEIWTGKECMRYEPNPPWQAKWTSSGPVTVHSVAGQQIPNGSEAAGWDNSVWLCNYDQRFAGSLWWTSGLWCYFYYDWGSNMGRQHCLGELCFDCAGGMPYYTPPSPIWTEVRNLGDRYRMPPWFNACNGPFIGVDATIKPFKECRDECPECWDKDCNCGRAMAGSGDRADGVKSDPGCNYEQQTACRRNPDYEAGDPATYHKCNCQFQGHGSFTDGDDCDGEHDKIENSTPTDPNNADADKIVPEVCGRIQRKELERVSGYYPRFYGDSPYNWINYTVTEYDENGQFVNMQQKMKDRDKVNILPPPANPFTLLKADSYQFNINERTRNISVEMQYTVENQINRVLYLKQCTWRGCSRLEEVVVHFVRTWDVMYCGSLSHWTEDHSDGPAPNCCLRLSLRPQITGCGPGGSGKQWTNWCGGCTFDDCTGPDGVPDGIPDTVGWSQYYDNCDCEYNCWGCWHYEGQNIWYPLTKPDESGNEQKVYEQINDTSYVTAKPFGGYLRVENGLTQSNSETKTQVRGSITYGSPTSFDYASGYLTVRMYDDESLKQQSMSPGIVPKIDMFSGLTLTIKNVSSVDVRTKQYLNLHTMTSLESTLPQDFLLIPQDLQYMLRLNDMCYKKPDLTTPYSESNIRNMSSPNPIYIRWLTNPAKKYYSYIDMFQASGSKYNMIGPFEMADWNEITCRNYFDERSNNIPLYRNFHEDEPQYYDYESIQFKPENIEYTFAYQNYDPSLLSTAIEQEFKKTMQSVYARQALPCDEPPFSNQNINNPGNCPDMCTAVAKVQPGSCDCEYLPSYAGMFPISDKDCKGAQDWRYSDLIPCEGIPSKYKSYCSQGDFYALWLDKFQFKYKWNPGANRCDIQYTKQCVPKRMDAKSVTLIFDSATVNEWNSSQLTLFSHLQSATVDPFGPQGPCDSAQQVVSQGGLDLVVQKPPPVIISLDEVSRTDTTVTLLVNETVENVPGSGICNGQPTTVFSPVFIKFLAPYTASNGWYPAGSTITITQFQGEGVTASMQGLSDSGFMKTRQFNSFVAPAYTTTTCDYMFQNMWVLVIAFLLVMSFQFFEGLDPYEFWKKYQGKE